MNIQDTPENINFRAIKNHILTVAESRLYNSRKSFRKLVLEYCKEAPSKILRDMLRAGAGRNLRRRGFSYDDMLSIVEVVQQALEWDAPRTIDPGCPPHRGRR